MSDDLLKTKSIAHVMKIEPFRIECCDRVFYSWDDFRKHIEEAPPETTAQISETPTRILSIPHEIARLLNSGVLLTAKQAQDIADLAWLRVRK